MSNWDVAAISALLKIINNDDSFLDHLRGRSNDDLARIAEVAGVLASAAKGRMGLLRAAARPPLYAPEETDRWARVARDLQPERPPIRQVLTDKVRQVLTDKGIVSGLISDHRFEADTPGALCQAILQGLSPEGACGRSEAEHERSAWGRDRHYETCADPKLCAETGSHPAQRHDLAPVGHRWADAETEQRGIQAHRTPEPYGGYEGNLKGSE